MDDITRLACQDTKIAIEVFKSIHKYFGIVLLISLWGSEHTLKESFTVLTRRERYVEIKVQQLINMTFHTSEVSKGEPVQ